MAFRPGYKPRPGAGQFITFRFQSLRVYNSALADKIAAQAGLEVDPQDNNLIRLEIVKLDPETQAEILAALPFAAKIVIDPMKENAEYNRIILDQANKQAKAKQAEQSGIDQLKLYYNAGLADVERNKDILTDYLTKNCNSIFDAATVRVAVESCRVNLEWRKVAPPPPPAPTTPAETLVTLSDGSVQLPLDKPVPRSATVEQAKDYLARVRAQQPYARSGSFGTRF